MLGFLYNLLIMPIEIVVECTFTTMNWALRNNCGLAIIAVSLVIQTLVLPLYKKSDEIQEEERQRQKAMAHWVTHIKKHFKGAERFMMLSTYYRQQGYKPWYALRSSMSVLLQIPFFLAAYHYLSNLSSLQGKSFLFVSDLGKPDALFQMWGLTVNILPILMTAINVVSGIIYTKKLPISDKIQTHGLAAVFLILLYDSPAGLVLYWTMNNVFSLCKNVIMGLFGKSDKVAVAIPSNPNSDAGWFDKAKTDVDSSSLGRLFASIVAFLTIFMGGLIALNVLRASPTEFIGGVVGGEVCTPATIVFANITIYAGIFLVWFSVFYGLMNRKSRSVFVGLLAAAAVVGFLNYIFWGNDFGKMSALLVYDEGMSYRRVTKIVNFLVVVVIGATVYRLSTKFVRQMSFVFTILALSALGCCVFHFVSIQRQMGDYCDIARRNRVNNPSDNKILKLSKHGKNVVVIMLDRAISGYVPYIFNEKPELRKAFDGFTWYPNTLSFGMFTNLGAPAVYGGYEYTPVAMNKRDEELLVDKHNESLLVLPRLFANSGYCVTVCDPPYAGYKWMPDLRIYDPYDHITAYQTEGKYTHMYFVEPFDSYRLSQQQAFVYYAFMRASPVVAQKRIYHNGSYFFKQKKCVMNLPFLNCYSALLHLTSMTDISNSFDNSFVQIQNSTTHEPTLLREPEYIPAEEIGHRVFDGKAPYHGIDRTYKGNVLRIVNNNQAAHYHVNMAAFLALADWFNYLKNNRCWDNTRIIIVSDHGSGLRQFDKMKLTNGVNVERFNPLLLVKDFDASGFHESKEFMTNADVPTLATQRVVSIPKNPFTGNRLDKNYKTQNQLVTTSGKWNVNKNNGYTFDTNDGKWFSVKPGNIFDENNWTLSRQ